MKIKRGFFVLLFFTLFIMQFFAMNYPSSVNNISNSPQSQAAFKEQSLPSHNVTINNFTTILQACELWISPQFNLTYGDFLYLNFTAVAYQTINLPAVDVNLVLPNQLGTSLGTGVNTLSTYYYVSPNNSQQGIYTIHIKNSRLFCGSGWGENVTGYTALIENHAPTIDYVQGMFIGQNFNFNSWNPADLDNDIITFGMSYQEGWDNYYGTSFNLVNNTQNINELSLAINNNVPNGKITLNINMHDPFSALNMAFYPNTTYSLQINHDTSSPVFLSSPGNLIINSTNTTLKLNWFCNDSYPSTYKVLRNSTIQVSGSWSTTNPIIYPVGALKTGTYNFTLIVYNILNYSASDSSFVTVMQGPTSSTSANNKLFGINGFELLSISILPMIYFLRKFRSKK